MPKKTRIPVAPEVAARILFLSDRTCCVCRKTGKPIQIHHIDEDPAHSDVINLAVLCLDCHNDTQLRGGFGRKLEAEQVVLYRDDWHRVVARSRADVEIPRDDVDSQERLQMALSIAEIYRENGEYELLAVHYDHLGNTELRDKYVERALETNPRDSAVTFLRGLQGRPDLIPEAVVERELARFDRYDDKLQRARLLTELGRHRRAALDYVEGIAESLKEERVFAAAYYLKELSKSGILTELFVEALGKATAAGDLWWQVRALEELGWTKELNALLLRNAEEIEQGGNSLLQLHLARARGDRSAVNDLRKALAQGSSMRNVGSAAGSDEPPPSVKPPPAD